MMEQEKKSTSPEEASQDGSTIFTAKGRIETRKKSKGFTKRRNLILIILGAVVVLAIALYFLVLNPYFTATDPEPEAEPIKKIEGSNEYINERGKLFMFEQLSRDRRQISEITVHNQYDDFTFYYDEEDKTFYLKDHEYAAYDGNAFSNLVVSAGYTPVLYRLYEKCDNWEEYGLGEKDDPAWFTITSRSMEMLSGAEKETARDVVKHKVWIGRQLTDGSGYYCRYDGLDALYVLDNSIETTLLSPIEAMISPIMAPVLDQNYFYELKNFIILPNGAEEPTIAISYNGKIVENSEVSLSYFKMLAPASYTVNTSNYTIALESLTSFYGGSVLVFEPEEEDLEAYGLSDEQFAYQLHYEIPIKSTNENGEQAIVTYFPVEILFSEKNENGNYYAYSLTTNIISEISGEKMRWLEWDLIRWVDMPLFMLNINYVHKITVQSPTATRVFSLVGEDQDLVVTETLTSFKPDVKNFRQFYKSILYLYMQDYVELTEEEIAALDDKKDLAMTLTIESDMGTKVFKFYPYSTRHAYYTLNGKGDFYVLRDSVNKIISDAEKVMTNEPIDGEARS